jgi:hypothetical protein
LKRQVAIIIIVLILGVVNTGCSHFYVKKQNEGYKFFKKASASLDPTPRLHETIFIDRVIVHIVGDPNKFKWDKAAAFGSPVEGYATHGNEIWILGTRVNGKIVINQAILGHELNHLLNFKNSEIADPDQLEDIFK